MEKDSLRSTNNGSTSNNTTTTTTNNNSAQRTSLDPNRQTTSSDLVLQWGNRKRLRCMKAQVKDVSTTPVHKTTVRVDRRVVRADNKDKDSTWYHPSSTNNNNSNHSNGYSNLRQRLSPPPPPPPQRILRYRSIPFTMQLVNITWTYFYLMWWRKFWAYVVGVLPCWLFEVVGSGGGIRIGLLAGPAMLFGSC